MKSFLNCGWVMWYSSPISNNTGDEARAPEVKRGTKASESRRDKYILLSYKKVLHCSKNPLNSLSSFCCSLLVRNFVLQHLPIGPSPSAQFEINVTHFSGSDSGSFASPWVVCIRMWRRPSNVGSWLYEFINLKK
jgi:hypothetical protein